MNSVINSCKLISIRMNKFGGYLYRGMATIDDYKIKWVRPVKIPSIDPRKSGDLGLNIPIKSTDIKLYYENSKELEDANDLVKKSFSLEFQRGKETRNLSREKTIELVKRHICDRSSPEVKIAAMTAEIQYLQKYIENHPRNKKIKIFLKELIDKRNKHLKLMRKWDYKRFEWLLERLNLTYIAQPEDLNKVTRKNALRKLTQNYCDAIIQEKLDAFKKELKEQQKIFYAEKAEKLKYILKVEKEYGLNLTVTQEDIEAALKKVEELSKENV
ncbi:28S ribosomal protein S15, mitochondrial [Apis dorsata]|uniref:28S ribosomal protein S15, mitochondrial n=1 Tax=Apis dorsata TaxID=7462 RepID=UPI0003DF6F2A|nr:28S ribosomal protein S15, mitochondrial [Apis dorsata]